MQATKLLIEGYLVFGIILSYAVAIIIGILIGEGKRERETEQWETSTKQKRNLYQ